MRRADRSARRRAGRCFRPGLILALVFCGAAWAQKDSPPKASSPQEKPAAPDPNWLELENEFRVAWQTHQAVIQKAQADQIPPDQRPETPTNTYWERCKAFADGGEIGAMRWCISYAQDPEVPVEVRNQRRLDLYGGWAKDLPEGPALKEVLKNLTSEAHPTRMGLDLATAFCSRIAERCQNPRFRGLARLSEALMLLGAKDQAKLPRARELVALGIQDDPNGELVLSARGKLFQLDNLQVGKPCPDFAAKDVDGVEIKLSDYRGKVVVLDFWGFW